MTADNQSDKNLALSPINLFFFLRKIINSMTLLRLKGHKELVLTRLEFMNQTQRRRDRNESGRLSTALSGKLPATKKGGIAWQRQNTRQKCEAKSCK